MGRVIKVKHGKKGIAEKLLDSRIIYLDGEINDEVASNITAVLLYLYGEDPKKDITMYINSPGGSISSGYAIRDVMNFIGCDVRTVCLGMAASMGAFLLASGTKGKRYILPNAEVMIHQPLGGTQGQATDIVIAANHISHLKEKMIKQMVEMTNMPEETIRTDVERDHWLTAEETLEYGIVDKIISSVNDTEPIVASSKNSSSNINYDDIADGDDDEDDDDDDEE